MKTRKIVMTMFLGTLFLALAACGGGEQEYTATPAMQMDVVSLMSNRVEIQIKSINAEACYVMISDSEPTAETLRSSGEKVEGNSHVFKSLEGGKDYVIYGVAVSGKRNGKVQSLPFTTKPSNVCYSWEEDRDIPQYDNLVLCYGGSRHRVPYQWSKERFAPHVTWKDDEGKYHWLFDSFLAIEFCETSANISYNLGQQRNSANKDGWQKLIDYWFTKDYGFDALNKAVAEAYTKAGAPKTKRKVYMTMPDPIPYAYYNDMTSSTRYWGKINGETMDFSKGSDRVAAMKWYIDEVRSKWNESDFDYLEFAGFYIVSEELAFSGGSGSDPMYGWNPELKRWEEVYPAISDYIHSVNEALIWIPYRNAAGYPRWQAMGIDQTAMQLGYFWHPENNPSDTFSKIITYKMGLELEFDDALLGDSNDAAAYRTRFRQYMSLSKSNGVYGKRCLAWYIGQDSFYNLSKSKVAVDKELFKEVCEYIIDSTK